jgi:vancomycin resistance protein VanJ
VTHRGERIRRILARPAIAGVLVIAALEWILILLRPEEGPLGAVQVVAPHLALVGLVLIPVCLLEPRVVSVGSAFLLGLAVSLRFGGDWVSFAAQPPPGAIDFEVLTWNLEAAARPGTDTVKFLHRHEADVLGLQELRPATAAAIEADPELITRYPYRVLDPRSDYSGMGILSRWPIVDSTFRLEPAIQEGLLDLGDGRSLALINAHPFHAGIERLGRTKVPFGLDSTNRDDDLKLIRGRIDDLISRGRPVVLLGDLNTAASEPAFDRFVNGLREVHQEVGVGPGWTWRPIRLEFLGIGLIRIDHIVVSPDIVPLGIGGECPPVGDHCLVNARLAVPGVAGG